MIRHLIDRVQGKVGKKQKRSPLWRDLRNAFIKDHPFCAVCGATEKLEVHHKRPFHMFPELELVKSNLTTLCRGSGRFGMKSCHRFFGHHGRWKKMNPDIDSDAARWREKLGVHNAR